MSTSMLPTPTLLEAPEVRGIDGTIHLDVLARGWRRPEANKLLTADLGALVRLLTDGDFGGESVTHWEGLLLYALVNATRPLVIAETGTHKGISAALLALASPEAMVHTCDVEDHHARVLWERHGLASRIWFHHRPSLSLPRMALAPDSVQFAFFDSLHEAAYIRREWEEWRDYLAPGALVAWHDSRWAPVLGAVLDLSNWDDELELLNLPTECGLALGQYRAESTWRSP